MKASDAKTERSIRRQALLLADVCICAAVLVLVGMLAGAWLFHW